MEYSNTDFCLAYECPLHEVPDYLLEVCSELGDRCDECLQRCSGSERLIY